jgi:hypothetical protein
MNRKQFYNIAAGLFGDVLGPTGFSKDRSRYCTFYRQASAEVYHFIAPAPWTGVPWYDVKVFPSSPVIDPLFDTRFPDALGIPTDTWCYLSSRGVGPDQETFNCKYEENLRRRFVKTVRPLLIDVAVPYLDRIRSVEEMIPWIRRPLALGMALHHVGRIEEARPILQQERARLLLIPDDSGELTAVIHRLNQILGAS